MEGRRDIKTRRLAVNVYHAVAQRKEQAEVKYAAEIRKTEDPAAVKGRPVIYNFLLPEIEDAREHISYYEELIQPDKVVE